MEYMMIRSVKNATTANSGNDISKPNLGLISGGNLSTGSNHLNHHSLYQHHHHPHQAGGGGSSHFSQISGGSVVGAGSVANSFGLLQQQHLQTTGFSNNSYANVKYYAPRLPANSPGVSEQLQQQQNWNVTNTNRGAPSLLATASNSVRGFGGRPHVPRKKSPVLLPIIIKSTLGGISKVSPVQNSISGLFSCGSGTTSSILTSGNNVYGGQQLKSCSAKPGRGGVGVAFSSARGSTTEVKKMNKFLWESSSPQQDNSEDNGVSFADTSSVNTGGWSKGSCDRKRKFADALNDDMFSSFPNKKTKLGRKTSLCMPNLLKSLTKARKSGIGNLGAGSSSVLNSFKVPGSKAAVMKPKTGVVKPIENVFLRKYDPTRLLKRLRIKTSSKTPTAAIIKSLLPPKKNKIVVVNDFPENRCGFTSEKSKKHVRSKVKNRGKKSSLASGSAQSSKFSKAGQTTKSRNRLPKYTVPKRRVNVKYESPVGSALSQNRLRVIAAVYLQRAISRARHGKKVKRSTIKSRLKRMRARRKKKRNVTNVSYSTTPGRMFPVAVTKLPRPIPIKTRSLSIEENPSQLHILQLLRHKRELQDRLEMIESDGSVQKVGPLPEKPENGKIPFLFANVPLKKREAKHVISQKLLISFATAGFTHSKLRPIEVMADATSNFFTTMAQRLKVVSEMEMHGVDHGFPDAMERVLVEQGLGGIRGLEEFYRAKVIDYGHRMEDQCLLLRRQYAHKVRSKVGMMSNVNASTSLSISATTLPSNPSVTNNNASSSSTIASVNGVATLPPVSGGVGGASAGTSGAVASKSTLMGKTSSSSSQPLSPGNSVLAEMLSSQEDLSARTPQGCPSSPSLGMMMMGSSGTIERQLEELMGATPPNVEIRPNSFPQPHHPIQQRQVPLQQLLASLSQQQSPQQQQPLLPPPSPQPAVNPYALYASSPPLTPPTPPHHLNPKVYQPHQASSQGQQQQPSHLTQLLQRPISNTTPPVTNTSHHLILHHHLPQHATPPPPQQQQASQFHHPQSSIKNTSTNTTTIATGTANTKASPHLQHRQSPAAAQSHPGQAGVPTQHLGLRQLVSAPLQSNPSKELGPLSSPISEGTTYSSNTITTSIPPAARTATSSNGTASPSNSNMQASKLITIIRSSSSSSSTSQGIILNSNHHSNYADSSPDNSAQENSVISINLGGQNDMDGVGEVNVPSSPCLASSSSKAKLKEAISQRNLLRLNFEQVPSGAGDSTVLLSSSSVVASSAPPSVANSNSVQFIGKVSGSAAGGGQMVSWNNTTNYS